MQLNEEKLRKSHTFILYRKYIYSALRKQQYHGVFGFDCLELMQ